MDMREKGAGIRIAAVSKGGGAGLAEEKGSETFVSDPFVMRD
jgi:hypothetical protein